MANDTPLLAVLIDADNVPAKYAHAILKEVTSFGEGLEGNKDAVNPTIAWGIAVFMIGFTTLFIGSRWKKWPSYLIGFFPFIVAVAIWFFNLEKTLPS